MRKQPGEPLIRSAIDSLDPQNFIGQLAVNFLNQSLTSVMDETPGLLTSDHAPSHVCSDAEYGYIADANGATANYERTAELVMDTSANIVAYRKSNGADK